MGKTTLARLMAQAFDAEFVPLSAVLSGVKDIREAIAQAQQDAFLPRVEAGDIVLIGATTENPSFEVNAALLSRSKVFVLHGLTVEEIASILRRALTDTERGLGREPVSMDDDSLGAVALYANGDARSALNLLELSLAAAPLVDGRRHVDIGRVEQTIQKRALLYDKNGEEHYNIISALHKSMRNSDPDASVYWLARMVEAGEDPLYIARRLVRFASEDIGNADPQALTVAVAVIGAPVESTPRPCWRPNIGFTNCPAPSISLPPRYLTPASAPATRPPPAMLPAALASGLRGSGAISLAACPVTPPA